ncbi:hypothetical protein GGX14DRAFT_619113 [Mycena pura]|uniref:Uncharacterized protein n=1 Tax=Mycena pura TaxID=153505 RepID=A0AAD6VM63_9AGAR|nr:hypothetical protein GGX14DRAFT_619113 [Mycena pura]
MEAFYGGKRCVYTRTKIVVKWSHQLDTTLASSELQWMLRRNLRDDRYPRHAGEVRENIVPGKVSVSLHAFPCLTAALADATCHHRTSIGIPSLTLFPHEDLLARTLEYELEVASIRQSQVEAGNADPGRPPYDTAYGVGCRVHMPSNLAQSEGITRYDPDTLPAIAIYSPSQCPGIGVPGVVAPFPVIPTLLSIPFALLHQDIIRLWSWDPVAPGVVPGLVVPASAASGSQNDAFQNVPSVASRTTTFQDILLRVGEAGTFPGAPTSSQDMDAVGDLSENDSDGSSSCGGDSSSSSGGGRVFDNPQHFVGGSTNDMLMACGHLDPGVYVQFMPESGKSRAASELGVDPTVYTRW